MAYLDTYTQPLTAATAAHLLRRATFGPTQQEITDFTGKTASQAVDVLISNASYRATPPPPVEMDVTRSDAGQPFLGKLFDDSRMAAFNMYIQYWWIGLMTEQSGHPSILEKLSAFWQNHFVVSYTHVGDYRYIYSYLKLLRASALGNFKQLTTEMTKEPAMLIFQNGNENTKSHPNENYARELQELFTVGQHDYYGNSNYTEQDVKMAARVLTGWQATNYKKLGSSTFESIFSSERHDGEPKTFSSKYGNTTITGRIGSDAGDLEVNDLVMMLLRHPESPKYICRKLYRWFVNTNVTNEIEEQVIVPLATFFSSPSNNFEIAPALRKLLTSNIFFDNRNVGAIIKSPSEFVIGTVRYFEMPVPEITSESGAFYSMMNFIGGSLKILQLNLLDQPTVFGSLPYYQTGYSRNWINGTTLGLRGSRTDALVSPYLEIKPGYLLGIDILTILSKAQKNFSDVSGTPALTCEEVLARFTDNLLATSLTTQQKDFLIDNIMMMNSSPRATWQREWNAYRSNPTDESKQNAILWRCRALLKYVLRMAEYQIF